MPTTRFSHRTVEALSTEKPSEEFQDPRYPNLTLRVMRKIGAKPVKKTWSLRYAKKGKRRRATLGHFPQMSVRHALAAYKEELEHLETGEPPVEEQIADLEERLAELKKRAGSFLTFQDLAGQYIERYAKVNKKSWELDAGYLRLSHFDPWREIDAARITRAEVIELLEKVAKKHPTNANRLRSLLVKMWNWAISVDLLTENICQGIPKPTKERPRTRVLTDSEIISLWKELPVPGSGSTPRIPHPLSGLAVRFALLTGQRRHMVCEMLWSEVDGEWWNVPPEKTKSGKPHRLWLGETAHALMDATNSDRRGEVFPIKPKAMTDTVTRARHRLLKSGEWASPAKLHDLRRTCGTNLASKGVPLDVRRVILNHSDRSVSSIYDLYSYANEVKEALQMWERKLLAILGNLSPEDAIL